MVQGCGASMAKCILFIVNVAVWIASIALVAIGGYILNNSSKYSDLFGEHSDTLTMVCGVTIGIGCFIFLVGFLGCCGAFSENSCFLKLYFTFLLVLVLAEFVAGILALVYKGDIKDYVQTELENQVANFYGLPDEKVITETIDGLQRDGSCCGAYNYTDYYDSAFSDVPEHATEAVPLSCCKKETTGCNAAAAGGKIADVSQIYTKGCKDNLSDLLEASYLAIGVAALVLIVVEIMAMCMSCCLIQGIKNKDYEAYA